MGKSRPHTAANDAMMRIAVPWEMGAVWEGAWGMAGDAADLSYR